jgi:hypothetical protein
VGHETTFALFSVSFIIIALWIINKKNLWGEFFAKKRSPKQRAQGNSLEIFPKITIFWERSMKLLKKLEDLGRFSAIFF